MASNIPGERYLLASNKCNQLLVFSRSNKNVLYRFTNPTEADCIFVSIKPIDISDYSHAANGCTHFIVKTKRNIY